MSAVKIEVHVFPYRYPIVSTSFIKKTFVSPLN